MEIVSIGLTKTLDKPLSIQLNLEQRSLDNQWLYSKVSEGWLTLDAYTKILGIRDLLQEVYPDLWDLRLKVNLYTIQITKRLPLPEGVNYGCYFGYEGEDSDLGEPDTHRYYGETNFNDYIVHVYDDENEPVPLNTLEQCEIRTLDFEIVVRFPELTISNSLGNSHKIYDLFLKLEFESQIELNMDCVDEQKCDVIRETTIPDEYLHSFSIENPDLKYGITATVFKVGMKGCRGRATIAEWMNGYAHSHLRSRDRSSLKTFTEWGDCCLGHGEILNSMIMLKNNFEYQLLKLILFQMDAFARWESLEGVPHIRMDGVIEGSIITIYPNMSEREATRYRNVILNVLQSSDEQPKLSWEIEDGKLSVVEDRNWERFIKPYDDPNAAAYQIVAPLQNLIFYKDSQGNIIQKNNNGNSNIMIPNPNPQAFVIFRGEQIVFQVFRDENSLDLIPEFHINPNLTIALKQKLENHANITKIQRDFARRANRLNSLPRDLR